MSRTGESSAKPVEGTLERHDARVRPVRLRREEHRFFTGLAVAALLVTVAGFARTYLLVPALGLPEGNPPFTPLVHAHAAVAFAWCLLFVVQTGLVATGRTALHRRLGVAGVALYGALVVLGPWVAIRSVARQGSPVDELAFLSVSLGNIVAYTLLFGAAIAARGTPAVHKRLMVLGVVAMLTAPFGRLTNLPLLLDHVVGPGLFVVALALWDRRALGRLHAVTRLGGPLILLWELAPLTYGYSSWWLATARELVALAL